MSRPESSLYQTLPPNAIRVLELQAGSEDMPLLCRLVVQQIAGENFEAVSYVWGDPAKRGTIYCNEKEMSITISLHEALTSLRLTHRVRRLWADAVCINQEDIEERQSQVGQMGSIYTRAQSVLGWLGRDPGTASLAIDHLQKFTRLPDKYAYSAKTLRDLEIAKDQSVNSNPEWQAWKAIKDLFDLPFFRRVWIIQELGLAKTALLHYGHHQVEWSEIANFVFIMDNKAAFLVVYLQLKSWIVNHTALIWVRLKNGLPRYNFLEVVNWARVHQATDPRDRIYGLLGHPSAMIKDGLIVQPDYSISTAQVYIRFAVEVIQKTKSLRILSAVEHDEAPSTKELPTWVPNWHTETQCAMLASATPAAPNLEESEEFPRLLMNDVLSVRGFIIDNVLAFSETIDQNQLIVTNLETELQKKIPFLMDHLWAIVISSDKIGSPTEEILDNLSLSLLEGFPMVRNPPSESLVQHRADFAAYLWEFERIHPNRHGSIVASAPLPLRHVLENRAAKGSAADFIQKMTWTCMARRVFVTRNGHVGIGHRIMKEGDMCCVLVGSVIPMMLRRDEASNETLLVGEALLHPFMDFRAIALYREGKLKLQRFHIK